MNILVTGKGSYIGETFKNYITKNYSNYKIDILDMLDKKWTEYDFCGYDTVFHVAGIAHQKETKENAHLYYEVNCDLSFEVAKKAKEAGVGQFIYLSSMSVYGMDFGNIDINTRPLPTTNYGKSKLMGEEKISSLKCDAFKVCLVRPPMVYGKGCRGNFQSLKKIAEASPVFPVVKNKRSMIYIDNLCEFIRIASDKGLSGIYFPQNKEYANTGAIVEAICEKNSKKIHFSFVLGLLVKILMPFVTKMKKAFGSLTYDIKDELDYSYCVESFKDSLYKSV